MWENPLPLGFRMFDNFFDVSFSSFGKLNVNQTFRSPKICCFFLNLAVNFFTITALHSANTFSNEQPIFGLLWLGFLSRCMFLERDHNEIGYCAHFFFVKPIGHPMPVRVSQTRVSNDYFTQPSITIGQINTWEYFVFNSQKLIML